MSPIAVRLADGGEAVLNCDAIIAIWQETDGECVAWLAGTGRVQLKGTAAHNRALLDVAELTDECAEPCQRTR